MKLKIYPYLFIGSLSCTTGVNKLDAQSEGVRTELENTQIENLNQEKRSIKDRLIAEILADGFVTDTNLMNIIAKYAYQDLRIGKFQQTKDLSFKYLLPENHSMAAHSLLEKGVGYYFVKKDSTGSTMNGVDFTVEFWIANTSDFARLREMEYAWLEDDYPMPSYFVLRSDTIVFFKTRSVQFAKSVEKYVNIANENEQHNTHLALWRTHKKGESSTLPVKLLPNNNQWVLLTRLKPLQKHEEPFFSFFSYIFLLFTGIKIQLYNQ